MASRLKFHQKLKDAVGSDVVVYFQAPNDGQMAYPCVVYERSRGDSRFAGNSTYLFTKRYTVTLITEDPDSPVFEALSKLPLCSHSTNFVADNLNHDVFDIYF